MRRALQCPLGAKNIFFLNQKKEGEGGQEIGWRESRYIRIFIKIKDIKNSRSEYDLLCKQASYIFQLIKSILVQGIPYFTKVNLTFT